MVATGYFSVIPELVARSARDARGLRNQLASMQPDEDVTQIRGALHGAACVAASRKLSQHWEDVQRDLRKDLAAHASHLHSTSQEFVRADREGSALLRSAEGAR